MLLLIDAYAMIYRAYYAFIRSPRVNSRGENLSAVFGFVTTLNDLQRRLSPSHIAVAFDPHGPTFRHEAYPEYKAQREETPEDIRRAVPLVKEVLSAMRIPVLEVPGYEADDIIGTLACRAAAETDWEVLMATPDKDYGQLVSDRVFMYRPRHTGGFEKMGVREVCDKYGIERPAQVIDLLGLMGDASDNIPGCRGVGEKTAVQLISQFGSIDNLLSHTAELRGALREKVESQAEQIRFSRYLATICTTVPLSIEWDSLSRREPNQDALTALYTRLEFRSLLPKSPEMVAKTTPKSPKNVQTSPLNTPKNVQNSSVNTPKNVPTSLQLDLFAAPELAPEPAQSPADTAFNGLLTGINGAKEPISQPVVSPDSEYVPELVQYMLNPEVPYNPATPPSMDALRSDERLYRLYREVELPLRGVLRAMESQGVRIDTARLSEAERTLSSELQSIEQRISALLSAPSQEPAPSSPTDANGENFNGSLTGINGAKEPINGEKSPAAPKPLNLNSPSQVGALLFDTLQLGAVSGVKPKRTSSGAYSTSDEVLQSLHDAHPVVPLIQDYRALRKLISTYITALPQYIAADGKIHAHYHQTATATGRLSCSDPNLQNLPVRTERGQLIREAVVPDAGCVFLSVDYSQIELRLLAHFSEDPHLCAAFREGQDIHAATAAKIFRVPLEQVTREQRRVAKTANFGIIYGISAFGLSGQLGCSRTEAKSLIDGYFAEFPSVRDYIEQQKQRARDLGYAETLFGRRRYLPDILSHNGTVRSFAERNAVNSPIQGTAADIIKMAMVRLANPEPITNDSSVALFNGQLTAINGAKAVPADNAFNGQLMGINGEKTTIHGAVMPLIPIMQVHDELNFSVPESDLDAVRRRVVEVMEGVVSLRVPLVAEAGVGANWLAAH